VVAAAPHFCTDPCSEFIQSDGLPRLIEAEIAAAGQANFDDRSPARFLDFREPHVLLGGAAISAFKSSHMKKSSCDDMRAKDHGFSPFTLREIEGETLTDAKGG
jgi:hypothetical protein